MALFKLGVFRSASGLNLPYKIECDALTPADWKCIAACGVKRMPEFGRVIYVPRGGLPLAAEMDRYVTKGSKTLLVCDDVYTTGGSMREVIDAYRAKHKQFDRVIGYVAFARNAVPIEVWAFCTVM